MPYCPKCGNFYYVGIRSCSTCGELLLGPREEMGDTNGEYKPVWKGEIDKRCPYCNSTGKVDGPINGEKFLTCPVCKGRRYNLIPEDWVWCRRCLGKGELKYGNITASFRKPCPSCNGTGWIKNP